MQAKQVLELSLNTKVKKSKRAERWAYVRGNPVQSELLRKAIEGATAGRQTTITIGLEE